MAGVTAYVGERFLHDPVGSLVRFGRERPLRAGHGHCHGEAGRPCACHQAVQLAEASHLSPAILVHGHPAPSLTGMSLIHGYTTAFWVAAAIFGAGAVACGTLFRSGPLRVSGPAAAAPARRAAQQAATAHTA